MKKYETIPPVTFRKNRKRVTKKDIAVMLTVAKAHVLNGHTKRRYSDDRGNVCAVGAVRCAAFGTPEHPPCGARDFGRAVYHGALDALDRQLAARGDTRDVVAFNDRTRTRKADVVQLFDDAIEAVTK